MIKQLILNILFFLSVVYLAVQTRYTLSVLERKSEWASSPVIYGELIPDKQEYVAGELIGFSYDRISKVALDALPLPMLTVDSFENLDTGEIFTGTSLLSRIIRRNGVEHLRALRRLSVDCTPGTYSFDGWISIQGTRPTQPVLYSSRNFKVTATPSPPQSSPELPRNP